MDVVVHTVKSELFSKLLPDDDSTISHSSIINRQSTKWISRRNSKSPKWWHQYCHIYIHSSGGGKVSFEKKEALLEN